MPRSRKYQFKIGRAERAFAGFVDDRLARKRGQLRDNLPAGFATYQDAAARTRVANAGADAPRPPALVCRKIGEIGPMPLTRVEDMKAQATHLRKHGC